MVHVKRLMGNLTETDIDLNGAAIGKQLRKRRTY